MRFRSHCPKDKEFQEFCHASWKRSPTQWAFHGALAYSWYRGVILTCFVLIWSVQCQLLGELWTRGKRGWLLNCDRTTANCTSHSPASVGRKPACCWPEPSSSSQRLSCVQESMLWPSHVVWIWGQGYSEVRFHCCCVFHIVTFLIVVIRFQIRPFRGGRFILVHMETDQLHHDGEGPAAGV